MSSSSATTVKVPRGSLKVTIFSRISGNIFTQSFPALPSKPLAFVTLSDADSTSALSFVKQKLRDVDLTTKFTKNQTALVERLGGRASDLESVSFDCPTNHNVLICRILCSSSSIKSAVDKLLKMPLKISSLEAQLSCERVPLEMTRTMPRVFLGQGSKHGS